MRSPDNLPIDETASNRAITAHPTMRQVAERAGVSVALVSLVMREAPNVSVHRRRLVLEAATELGYRPNVLARNLASRRTRTIGIVVNDLHNPFFAECIDGLQEEADRTGYRLLLGNGKHSRSGEADALETFLQFRVDGLVLAGPTITTSSMEQAAGTTPIVIVGRKTRSTKVDSVNTDDESGAGLAVDHLVALGHRRIAHVDGGTGAGASGRRQGYKRAMSMHGLEDQIMVASGDFSEAGGRAATVELLRLRPRPTAIFASNDLSAVGALDAIEDASMQVPRDMSIVGYDNTSLAALHHMSLTTIDQPRADIGRMAIRLLLERLDGGRTGAVHHVVAPTLVERNTSRKPMAERRK